VTAAELVGRLAAQGARLSVQEGRLRYHGPAAVLTDELRQVLQQRKEELLAFLGRTRFTREELAALGFVGTPCADGSGLWDVRA